MLFESVTFASWARVVAILLHQLQQHHRYHNDIDHVAQICQHSNRGRANRANRSKLTSRVAFQHFKFTFTQHTAVMPKEKATTRAAKKGGKADGGRKKKGQSPACPAMLPSNHR
jgi:hypothetical protein